MQIYTKILVQQQLLQKRYQHPRPPPFPEKPTADHLSLSVVKAIKQKREDKIDFPFYRE